MGEACRKAVLRWASRVRQAVAGSRFPAEKTRSPGWLLALIAVGCATIAGARQGSAGLNTIWAEDGQVFYQAALTRPLHAFVQPWQGYQQVAPRIIAAAPPLFPVNWVAAAIGAADAIAIGLLAALAYRACGEHIRNPWLRAVPAVTMAACPVGQETWGAITNLQWPMYFVAILVLLWNPRRLMPIAVGSVMMVLLTLTSPFGLLLLPIAVARMAALGSDRGSIIPLATLSSSLRFKAQTWPSSAVANKLTADRGRAESGESSTSRGSPGRGSSVSGTFSRGSSWAGQS